jgi:uncharacterized BrkB/YihY/UPF0761 family membrane protein
MSPLPTKDEIRRYLPDLIAWGVSASKQMDELGVRLYAAAIAYRTIFSLIAFLSTFGFIALALGLTPGSIRDSSSPHRDIGGVSSDIEKVGWEKIATTLQMGNLSAAVAGTIGFLVGLYTLSAGFAALCEVLDRVHNVHTYRRMSRRYIRGAGMSLLFLLLASITGTLLLLTTGFGEFVFGELGLEIISKTWKFVFRVVIPACALVITFGFVLRYGSHARPPWGQVLPGAAVGSAAWLLLLAGFVSYAKFFNGFEGYGALASAIAVLLFGYLQAYIIIGVALFRSEIAMVIALAPGIRRAKDGASVKIDLSRGPDA